MDRRRVVLLVVLFLLPLAGLEMRLVYLQLFASSRIVGRLRESFHQMRPVSAYRGRILDRTGAVLAQSDRSFQLHLVLRDLELEPGQPDPRIADRLLALLALPRTELEEGTNRIYSAIRRHMKIRDAREHYDILQRERATPYLWLPHIPFEAALEIETAPEVYRGCVVRESVRRSYPKGPIAGSLVGYVSPVSAGEESWYTRCERRGHEKPLCAECRRGRLQELAERFFSPEFREITDPEEVDRILGRGAFQNEMVGTAGLEKFYDDALRGRPGVLMESRNESNGNWERSEMQSSLPGLDLTLTLDIGLQEDVEHILREARTAAGTPARATAVVLAPDDGAVLALASSVGYDPNVFVPPGSPEKKAAATSVLKDDANQPLRNRAVAQHFQLGSIFKIVTAVAALEEHKTSPVREVDCQGKLLPHSNFFHCWIASHGSTHGPVNLDQALAQSCNIYFYRMGGELGLEAIHRWGTRLGLGRPTGIDLPGELPGVLPDPASHRSWKESDSYSLAIGQHELMTSPIQVARLLAAVANGGKLVVPHLVSADREEPEVVPLSPSTLSEVRKGLHSVVHAPHGTAHASELAKFDAAGKTSSAQTRKGADSHAWFAGYFPFEKPRAVIVVLVEQGGGGGAVAAPLAARIASCMQDRSIP